MSIKSIIEIIKSDGGCQVLPVSGALPLLPNADMAYPNDLVEFYSLCGGVILFRAGRSNISFKILPAGEVLQTNMLIVGEPCEDDISFHGMPSAKRIMEISYPLIRPKKEVEGVTTAIQKFTVWLEVVRSSR